jgi:hypothetical protein
MKTQQQQQQQHRQFAAQAKLASWRRQVLTAALKVTAAWTALAQTLLLAVAMA